MKFPKDSDISTHSYNRPAQCGLFLKRDYSMINFMAAPALQFTNFVAAVYTSAMMVFMLRDPTYFGIATDEIGRVTSLTLLIQLTAQVITSIGIGFLYDLIGRRITVILSFVIMCTGLILIPLSAPSVLGVTLARGLLGVGIQM